ncbi:copper homeostasis protein CutC [Sinomonas halotolerans]|uniref:PF03932 family protein CutC n=1 Tax=Sinomonas halotolerans TaxID=1644133 RepID=A0ABU9X0J9_9MICC
MAGVLRGGSALPDLEFAVEDAAGVRLAASVGATRVELCAALAETGGVTPSGGAIRAACGQGLPVHVLVRPRPGGFVYTREELDVIGRDAVGAVRAGAAGVVVGALAADGGPDAEALSRLVAVVRAEAPGAEVTFHRAFDAALAGGADPADALARLARAGADRVLTSGGAPDCGQGLGMLGRLVELGREHAPGLQIMAGGGVTAELVPGLLAAGVHAVHASARRRAGSPGGGTGAGSGAEGRAPMDPELAAAIAAAARRD